MQQFQFSNAIRKLNLQKTTVLEFYVIVNSAVKMITSRRKWINQAQNIPLVSIIDFAKSHPKNPENNTPTIPPGCPQK